MRYDDLRTPEADPVALEDHARRTAELERALRALGPSVEPLEAARVARATLAYSMELAHDYRLTKPPIAHNVLVNTGLRPRGLCTHWAEDILRMLIDMDLESFDLYWGVAYPRRPWRLEHSTPVITARGGRFEDGLVLDAWRDSGWLYWGKVTEDKRYRWQDLPHKMGELANTDRL